MCCIDLGYNIVRILKRAHGQRNDSPGQKDG